MPWAYFGFVGHRRCDGAVPRASFADVVGFTLVGFQRARQLSKPASDLQLQVAPSEKEAAANRESYRQSLSLNCQICPLIERDIQGWVTQPEFYIRHIS